MAEFKAKLAKAALRELYSIAKLAQPYRVHPSHVASWKRLAHEAVMNMGALARGGGRRAQ